MSSDIFGCLNYAGEGELLAHSETKDVARYPTIHRTGPSDSYLAQNVNYARLQKPCPKPLTLILISSNS